MLKVKPGQVLRAGVLGEGFASASVLDRQLESGSAPTPDSPGPQVRMPAAQAAQTAQVELQLGPLERAEPPCPLRLILAIPRPKVLSRLLQALASLGVSQIELCRAWKVERSYLDSPRLAPERLHQDLLLGCEQGGHPFLPGLRVHQRFSALLEALAPASPRELRLVLHPRESPSLANRMRTRGEAPSRDNAPPPALCLALGPEGGWIEAELSSLERLGFERVSLGLPVLATTTAAVAAVAQITALRSFVWENGSDRLSSVVF